MNWNHWGYFSGWNAMRQVRWRRRMRALRPPGNKWDQTYDIPPVDVPRLKNPKVFA